MHVGCLLFRKLADVDPFQSFGILEKFIQIQLDGAVAAADCRKDSIKTLHADIEIDRDPGLDPEGAYAAYRVPDHLKDFVRRQHLGFEMKFLLKLMIVDSGIACCKYQHAAVTVLERQGLCNPGAFHTDGGSRQIDRCR